MLRDALAVIGGYVIGMLSGVAGVGGGILLVPLMVLGFGIKQHVAQGTSLAAIIPTAIVGAYTHARHGDWDRRAALLIGVFGVGFGILGAAVAVHLPREILARLFGLLLLFAAYRMWRPAASK